MNMTRWIMIAALALLGCSWAQADITNGTDFTIILTGWDPGQSFTFTANPTLPSGLPTDDPCYPSTDACGDPGVGLAKGGDATDITTSPFSFTAGAPDCTTVGSTDTCDFQNDTGSTITSIDISTIITADESGANVQFTCSGGNVETNCAFVVVDPPQGSQMNVYFFSTPEPSLGIILMLGFSAMMFVLARRAKTSA
jgi:hypothetical protein